MEKLKYTLGKIIGASAIENDMEVPEDIKILSKALNYMGLQISLLQNNIDDNEIKEIIEEIINNTIEILDTGKD